MSARFCTLLGTLFVTSAISLTGCSQNARSTVVWEDNGMPRHNPASKSQRWNYKFVYFPGEDVYFEPYTTTYFWYDGDFWYEGQELPKHIDIGSVEPKVVLLPDAKPYMSHGTVVARHFGAWKTVKPGATDISFHGEYTHVGMEQDWTNADYAGMCGGEQFMCLPGACPMDNPLAAGASGESNSTSEGESSMTTMVGSDMDN